MSELVEPLKVTRRAATTIERMRADVEAHFCNAHFDLSSDARRGQTRTHTSVCLEHVQIDHFQAVGGVISGINPKSFELGFAIRGGISVERGRDEQVALPGGNVVSFGGAGSKIKLDTLPGSIVLSLCFSPHLLQKAGASILGDTFELEHDRLFDPRTDASRALVRNTNSIFVELMELEKVGLSALAGAAYEELLANLAIAAMYPELTEDIDSSVVAPRLVERAQEIIAARAASPVSIQDVALELGVTVRTLQLEFRKHRGFTPLQFLINRRLTMAREKLLNPTFGGNVHDVAMSCGFTNGSKFSSRYRAMFGELPSETLARGRIK